MQRAGLKWVLFPCWRTRCSITLGHLVRRRNWRLFYGRPASAFQSHQLAPPGPNQLTPLGSNLLTRLAKYERQRCANHGRRDSRVVGRWIEFGQYSRIARPNAAVRLVPISASGRSVSSPRPSRQTMMPPLKRSTNNPQHPLHSRPAMLAQCCPSLALPRRGYSVKSVTCWTYMLQ